VCEVRYRATNESKLASGQLALGVGKGFQNQNMCKRVKVFSPGVESCQKRKSYVPKVEARF
jgi:hypothetical protein